MTGMVVVTVSMGVMKPLLSKLAKLMGDEYKKLKGVRKQVSFLQGELTTINAFLETLAFMDDDELDLLTKTWRDNVREMSYDMEDCIDDFMHHLDGPMNIARRLKTMRARHQIAKQMDELKARAIEANKRRKRYELDGYIKSRTYASVTVDPRMAVLYQDAANLVGIDGPREELIKWLTDDTHQKLVVVSIVGFGGLGKTTLAKAVYDKIGDQYDCKAFVSVSQRPDMTRLLNSIGSELGAGLSSQDCCDVKCTIDKIRDYLKHKRYFLVVDDLWDQKSWDTISWCFPENGNGCRVIVTTRVEDVATLACSNHHHIHRMKPLNGQDSARLFFNRIFGSEDDCPPQFKQVSGEILERCGGLPLAIITIASLLASRPTRTREEWEGIRNSFGRRLGTNATLGDMRQILDLSYKNLPQHLKACLLYLGLYPEDYNIKVDDLVRKWISEGFVSSSHGQDLEDVGKSYFNELVNRSLVQPLIDEHRGEVLYCRVHDMMLDLILSRCEKDNFIKVVYGIEDVARLGCEGNDRRLSMVPFITGGEGAAYGTSKVGTIPPASMPQVRSIVLFEEFMYRFPLMPFKHLRVLDMSVLRSPGTSDESVDLTTIGQMFLLRYVKFDVLASIELPSKIGRLVHLETLLIYARYQISLPTDIVSLSRLRHMHVPYGTKLPEHISNMKSLRTLQGIHLSDMDMDLKSISELTNLRDLEFTCPMTRAAAIDALGYVLGKLRRLKRLWVIDLGFIEDVGVQLDLLSDPPELLELLELPLGWRFSGVPTWINGLHNLRILRLYVAETSADEIRLLGELPSLFRLSLHVLRSPDIVVIGAELFPSLEHLWLSDNGDGAPFLGFSPGAMPKLRRLALRFNEWEWSGVTPAGMEHLLSLQKIHVRMNYYRRDDDDERLNECSRAGRAFSNAAQAHPSRPAFDIESFPERPPV